ncbi:glutamine--tRNA ligase [Psittacicella melopsittaci]|uniref:Glutamine--tRNA ligase n=1 Tax=Psittacicella melopsittaci TaxID=2028576 RepID=A0A3A1Y7Q1_9GAMM|nr:glutamine--tRNA ligase [Psittacicella melopsittaci]RIY33280.1 glutamine--tRNA ligase [Psittacicella melopsittaci]
MSVERPTNFIYNIIEEDLASGKYQTTYTRFPPEPNGYLHIGHVKSICLNFGIKEDFNGKCNLRFDDTNPVKEKVDFVKSIEEDVRWLGFEWDGKVRYASDYFDALYEYAIELIKKGLAYVDELSPDQIRQYRGDLTTPGTNSPYRDRSVEENLRLFEKMRAGGFAEGSASLRAKIDMASPFMVMRDPVLYRIKFASHHQTGDKWCIYPMYDFTHCISDALEGITHSLCTLEFQDNRRLYDWVLENITIDGTPHQYEFARLNLEYVLTSKRKLTQLVEEKIVNGWDDPRMPTVAGLRRRGYTPASLREFCRRIGVSKQDNLVEYQALEACIRDDLNEKAPRAMAVIEPIKLVITNYEGSEQLSISNHPQNESYGHREVEFGPELYIERNDFAITTEDKGFKRLLHGGEVRLRGSYVIKAESYETDSEGNVTTVYATYDPDTLGKKPEGRKVKGVIHWVNAKTAKPAEFRHYDHLFTSKTPGAHDVHEILNPNSLIVLNGFIEPALDNAKVGDSFQFERNGYYCKDEDSTADKAVFNLTVELKARI